jgi:oxaloacetate decarboxylase alpha subunit
MPDTRMQMLLRGQNVVGYRNYADDVVHEFVALATRAGIDVFRVFDALNDPRNMEASIEAVKENGQFVEATICYTKSPVHNVQTFLGQAGRLAELGAQSFCIKDMAGLLDPNDSFELVHALKSEYPDVLVHMHCHYTSGMASMAYLKAVEAGADILDCAISSMSMGTSHPPTESMVAALAGTDRETGMDIALLKEISEYFRGIRKNYSSYESAFTAVDPAVLLWQIPGGMISNLSSQLKEQGALGRMDEVLLEVPRVRKELGYPPLVTPSSQIVGTQATLNVLMGRYKMIPKETKAYVMGQYGKPPGPIDPEVQRLCIGDERPITTRPADSLEPELPKRRAELGKLGLRFTEEDLVSYALFPQVALEFFDRRDRKERPKAELAALAAAVADLLGVQEEAAKAKVCAPPVTAPAWAVAARKDLTTGRADSWRY